MWTRCTWLFTFLLAVTRLSCLETVVVAFNPSASGRSVKSCLIPPSASTDANVPSTGGDLSAEPLISQKGEQHHHQQQQHQQQQQQQPQQRRGSRPTRRKSSARRPRNYWRDIDNVDYELRTFWSQLQVQIPKSEPPPIPNESLLRHMGRHNLRAAIVAHGGRELLSEQLGGARIIPGKWIEAVATSPELQQLVEPQQKPSQQQPRHAPNDIDNAIEMEPKQQRQQQQQPMKSIHLYRDIPPWSLPQVTNETSSILPEEALLNLKQNRWCHTQGRNPKGYWTLQQVIQELYEYLDDYKRRHGRPAVWMPRASEIGAAGRVDLHQACSRFGGITAITQLAGLISFREWNYFEGQFRMLIELKRYLDEFHHSNYSVFPTVLEMQRNGYEELHALIQYYGGRKFVASRLSMEFAKRSSSRYVDDFAEMQWGAFDLEFGIHLLHFVREEQLKQMPPMAKPAIAMPSQSKLLSTPEGQQLDNRIKKYGGYENVARRLGLAFFD